MVRRLVTALVGAAMTFAIGARADDVSPPPASPPLSAASGVAVPMLHAVW